MDHHLGDSLNLETAMGLDFETTEEAVVSQEDITLEEVDSQETEIPMEFEQIEERSMLMDTSGEEIIDFMGDQFALQEYSIQDDQTSGLTTTAESNQQILSSQSETMIDLQFKPETMTSMPMEEVVQPKLLKIVTHMPASATAPRPIAIAPKPPKLVTKTYAPNKQFAIAPKPITMITNRTHPALKKSPLAGIVQGTAKGGAVLAQIGKQLVMMPAGSQKIKLVTAASGVPKLQIIKAEDQIVTTKSSTQGKPMISKLTKVIVQGQPGTEISNQPMLAKILPAGTTTPQSQTRYVTMQQKTVPISLANKVLMPSPTKQNVKFAKKQQIIAIKSPTPKLLPAPAPGMATKKVVINTSQAQNVILKTTPTQVNKDANIIIEGPRTQLHQLNVPSKGVNKEGNIIIEGQRTQLHQINVPGKGIQYIRLVTNPTPTTKAAPKPQNPIISMPGKTFVLTDTKGNVIQMAEKIGGPPPLVMATAPATIKVASKPQQKLVRIAPVPPKTTQSVTQPSRSSQSLLAPLSPVAETILPDVSEFLETQTETEVGEEVEYEDNNMQNEDSKSELKALIERTVAEEERSHQSVKVEFHRQSPEPEMDEGANDSNRSDEHPLIVIPPTFHDNSNDDSRLDDSQRSSILNFEGDMLNPFHSPRSPQDLSESDLVSGDIGGMRPRKACNCTKSQCLKLYCDCFANGEFCNSCNCTNCHNNLKNEELRQKAIRGCLDRNPNAFRPKIGKGKTGGPEVIRRHNKGCNCKRSGCLKNYCECYEAKIACTSMCKCVGCRNVTDTLERARRREPPRAPHTPHARPPHPALLHLKQPCSFMTTEVIEAVCQCLLAAAVEPGDAGAAPGDPLRDVIEEFARCLQDIISASHQPTPLALLDEGRA